MSEITSERFRGIFYVATDKCSRNRKKKLKLSSEESPKILQLVYHHHHHHMSVMELDHLLTRSGLTYLEVSSEVCHDSFCQLGNRVSLPG